jgi:hypothetical protein
LPAPQPAVSRPASDNGPTANDQLRSAPPEQIRTEPDPDSHVQRAPENIIPQPAPAPSPGTAPSERTTAGDERHADEQQQDPNAINR